MTFSQWIGLELQNKVLYLQIKLKSFDPQQINIQQNKYNKIQKITKEVIF